MSDQTTIQPEQLRELTPEELVRHLGEQLDAQRSLAADVRELVRALREPALFHSHTLTAARPIVRDSIGGDAASIGLINPSPALVYVGLGGVKAAANNNALSMPAGSVLVLPITANYIEIGADAAALAAGDALVHVLRYRTVQPLYMASL